MCSLTGPTLLTTLSSVRRIVQKLSQQRILTIGIEEELYEKAHIDYNRVAIVGISRAV